jgi:DNA polymerase III psi subunit
MEQDDPFKTIYQEEVYSVQVPVTVVLNKAWKDVPTDQRLLLAKILQAVKLSTEAVRIIQQTSFDLSGFVEKPKRMIAFMTPPKGLSPYEVIVTGETSVVFSDGLEMLNQDDAAKRKLWNTLKSFFSA